MGWSSGKAHKHPDLQKCLLLRLLLQERERERAEELLTSWTRSPNYYSIYGRFQRSLRGFVNNNVSTRTGREETNRHTNLNLILSFHPKLAGQGTRHWLRSSHASKYANKKTKKKKKKYLCSRRGAITRTARQAGGQAGLISGLELAFRATSARVTRGVGTKACCYFDCYCCPTSTMTEAQFCGYCCWCFEDDLLMYQSMHNSWQVKLLAANKIQPTARLHLLGNTVQQEDTATCLCQTKSTLAIFIDSSLSIAR